MRHPSSSRSQVHASALLIVALTSTALVAFAANSIFSRLALGPRTIDPYAYTVVRLASGTLMLALVNAFRSERRPEHGNWKGAIVLVLYALPFSLAYVRLETGAGALLLFASGQIAMMSYGLRRGERPGPFHWLGLGGAMAGVTYLLAPGLTAPDPLGAMLMVAAGVCWGLYSVIGKSEGDPARMTGENFRRSLLLIAPATILAWPWLELSIRGVLLAAASGALASGLGYIVWYAALKRLTLTRAALVQLAVPVIAAAGGVILIEEAITVRLVTAGAITLGSIALATIGRARAGRGWK